MKLCEVNKNLLNHEISKLKRMGIKDFSNVTSDWLLILDRPYGDVSANMRQYARVKETFGQYVAVEIPIDKIIPLLERDYVKDAEVNRASETLYAAG